MTAIVSICAIVYTNINATKERKDQQNRYEEEKKRLDEVAMLHERPYLVFKEAKISTESDEKTKKIDIVFINKGRGAAYDIIPDLKCTVNTMYNEAVLTRCDAIQDPIAMVGENFRTIWTLGYKAELVDFVTTISIKYSDASARKYIQRFNIIFNKEGYASITNFAQPELCKE